MTGYVLPSSSVPKKRFHDGSEPALPTFIRYPERPLRPVPVDTPSSRTGEMLSLVLDGRRESPLQHIGADRQWVTPRRAALAAAAIVIYLGGFMYGYAVARRAVVVESAMRAELGR